MAEEKIAQQTEPQAAVKATSEANASQANNRGNGRPEGKRPQGQGKKFSQERGGRPVRQADPFANQVVAINKVTKVVKGGKHMRLPLWL